MAVSFFDRVKATFDPYTAVEDGKLVTANGYFDGGKNGSVITNPNYQGQIFGKPVDYSDKVVLPQSGVHDISDGKLDYKSPPVSSILDGSLNSNSATDTGDSGSALTSADKANLTTETWLKKLLEEYNTYYDKVTSFNQSSADKAYERSRQEARELREWQERMSNTQYQRAVDDMRKAGLNPMLLAARGFSGASTPSGAAGSASSASISIPSLPFTSAQKQDSNVAAAEINQDSQMASAFLGLIGTLAMAAARMKGG